MKEFLNQTENFSDLLKDCMRNGEALMKKSQYRKRFMKKVIFKIEKRRLTAKDSLC